ncbi:MAG: hypothetical protein KDK36_17850 [Leptospiraceae bacterium]|nr:hypothetical protein [Leptospiraceae bacterium]
MKKIYTIMMFVSLYAILFADSTETFDKSILDRHNYYRSQAGLPEFKEDAELKKLASKWAKSLQKKGCKMQHSPKSFRKGVGSYSYIGENLYYYYSSRSFSVGEKHGNGAVDSWYSEIEDFQYSSKGVICPKRGKKGAIGHFTQVMWEDSTNLGCAAAQCNGGKKVVVVCNYGPGGNFNQRTTPPFPESVADKLNSLEINKKYGGLPKCD